MTNHFVPHVSKILNGRDVDLGGVTACGRDVSHIDWRRLFGAQENISEWVDCAACLNSEEYLAYELQR